MVRQQAHGLRAFRMCHYRHAGVLFLQGKNLVPRELHVHVAGPVPQFQGAAKLAAYPCTQILVRDEQDGAALRSLGDDFYGIPGSDDYVRQRLDADGAVHIRHYIVILMGVFL